MAPALHYSLPHGFATIIIRKKEETSLVISMYFTMKSKIDQSKCAILLLINKNKNHSKVFSNISPIIGLRATCKSENSYYNKKCYT